MTYNVPFCLLLVLGAADTDMHAKALRTLQGPQISDAYVHVTLFPLLTQTRAEDK